MLRTSRMFSVAMVLLASQASWAAEAKPVSKADVQGEEVVYVVGGKQHRGYIAYDKAQKGRRPGVLVVHEWWGNNDYSRKRANMLAELGYTALALDMFGDGKRATAPDEAQKLATEVYANMGAAKERFLAAKTLLEAHPTVQPGQIAAIGYCFGGGIVLQMARAGVDLKGVASFHGSLGTPTPAKKGDIKAKVLVLHGNADPLVPKEEVAAFKKEMKEAGVDMQFIAYEGATHAFSNPQATENGKRFAMPIAYDKKADEQSWKALQSFLRGIF